VLGEPGEHAHPLAWERECAERALAAVGSARVMVIGKSLASLLASSLSERDLPAVWLTPLLGERSVIDALARARCPTLLIGGTADAAWQPDAIPTNPVLEVVQLPGLDHALQIPSDPVASLDALHQITESVGRLAARA
jgi:pimeloyl-ACP methyl ester carboxylesterase